MKRRSKILRFIKFFGVAVVFFSYIQSEVLVRIKNITREDIKELRKSIFFSIENAGDEYVEIIVDKENLAKIEKLGYPTILIVDMDSVRQEVLSWKDAASYHSYSEVVNELLYLSEAYPALTKLDTIGYSVEGRLLLVIKISDNADIKEPEPEVRIVGTHHGNEWISTEIPLLLARYLLENYGSNPEVTHLVNNREIWIYPTHNPDGHESVSRYNANGVDLNRDYGYMWDGWGGSTSPYSQPETRALVDFSQKHNFVLSLSYHSFGEVVNYIYNYSPLEPPDSLLIREYSYGYASFNGYWVTEGYDWYETHGDLNDYSYGIDSDIDWTIELGNTFIPDTSQIIPIWLENRDAILYIIRKAGCGIKGFIFDATTADTIKNARITVLEVGWPVFTDPETGDFVKVLLPGTYTVKAEASGYAPQVISDVTVYNDSLTYLEFYLNPGEDLSAYKLWISNIEDPNNSFQNLTYSIWALGPPDGLFASLGVDGEIVLRFSKDFPIQGAFVITEGDDGNSMEEYSVYASDDYYGPWTYVASGSGTDTFSLSGTGLDEAHFIKIIDDGDGNPDLPTAGFDLDAIAPLIVSGISFIFIGDSVIDNSGNANGYLDPGETALCIVKLQNIGSTPAQNLHGKLISMDTVLTVADSLAFFGSVSPGSTVINIGDPFEIHASEDIELGEDVSMELILTADGFLDTLEFSIKIGVGGDFLVYDPDPNHSSGPIIKSILDSLGFIGDYTTSLTVFADVLLHYKALFITVGVYPSNYVIYANSDEALLIESYLIQYGGNVYLEGGDVWYWDPLHENGYNFGPLFGLDPVSDGSGDLTTILGAEGTFTEGMNFVYAGENNYIDVLDTLGGFLIFQNQTPQYTCGVAYETDYNTVGVSFELGGLENSSPPSTKRDLIEAIVNFFGLAPEVEERADLPGIPKIYSLLPPVPNPFRRNTIIRFFLPKESKLTLKIYDVSGRTVRKLISGKIKAGVYRITFDGKDGKERFLPSGIYFVRLETEGFRKTRRLVLFK